MAGEPRIIAFGANGPETSGSEPVIAPETPYAASSDSGSASSETWDMEEPTAGTSESWQPALAIAAIVAWTAFFAWSQWPTLSAAAIPQVPGLLVQWATPVLLVIAVWLVAMRTSRREAARFGDAAAVLSRESANLQVRLSAVNGELSLARDFVAAQSRDLESLGRLAVERLTQNADRLQALIKGNSAQLEAIEYVSKAALDNMDRLRGQLPVIASASKDVTNQIANAGRTSRSQLNELTEGLERLTEAGNQCDRQVDTVREGMDRAASEFARTCASLEELAGARFDALAERGAEFRIKLESEEVQALASVRTRAGALEQEVEGVRRALDEHEAESLRSLRARIAALRDESGVVGRALQDNEARAVDAWQSRLAALESQQTDLEGRLAHAEQASLDAARQRIDALGRQSAELTARLSEDEHASLGALEDRADRLAARAIDLQSRIAAGEQAALTMITGQLASLDTAIAARLEEHERHSDALVWRTETVAGVMKDHAERMAAAAQSGADSEAVLGRSLALLGERLTASRTTLAATEDEVTRLTEASVRLLELIQASAKHSSGVLPEALAVADDRLSRLGDKVLSLIDDIESGTRRAGEMHGSIDTLRDALGAVQVQIEAGQNTISDRNETHYAELAALRTALDEVSRAAGEVEERTRTQFGGAIEQLGSAVRGVLAMLDDEGGVRVRAMAERLGQESAGAIDRVMRPRTAEAAGALEQAIAHASGAGHQAAVQMREQLAAVEEAVGHLEGRVEAARERAQEQVDNDFSRRAALITDALKSNAIDITTALSAEVADTAWSSYLRGDRGIFTRRAVSLLNAAEARAIQQSFERDDAFREHVSRYIHDFEALLRQVLPTRDGNALGVTLLSSDMGKLYVALAQGIERLRS